MPIVNMTATMTRHKVISDLIRAIMASSFRLSFYSSDGRSFLGFSESNFAAALRYPIQRRENGSAHDDDFGRVAERAGGQRWHRLRARGRGLESELLEGNIGDEEHAGSARFLHAVDVRHVRGVFANPLPGFGDQLVAVAEDACLHRTGFGAGGLSAGLDAV